MKTGIIYKATNKVNGKIYIGQTIVSLTERMGDHLRKAVRHGSNSHFHNSIRKHGIESFSWEIIDKDIPRQDLNQKEIYWIAFYKSADNKYGYNMTFGGDSFEITEDTRKKISEAGKGRRLKPDQIEKNRIRMTGEGNPFYGKTHDEETRIRCGIRNIGRKLTDEHKAKCVHRGSANGMAKINEEIVKEIKKAIASGERNCHIYRRFGISKNTFNGIKNGNTWRHIQ